MFLMLLSSLGLRKKPVTNCKSQKSHSEDFKIDLLVTVSLPLDFPEDVDSVVIPQGTRHLVIVHREVVLLDPPELGQAGRVHDLEDSGVLVLPGDVVGVTLLRIVEQLLEKVPKEPPVGVELRSVLLGRRRRLRC